MNTDRQTNLEIEKSIAALSEEVSQLSVSPPESMGAFQENLRESLTTGTPITFFSWKMFKSTNTDSGVNFNYTFDREEAERYIGPEKNLISALQRYNLPIAYLKIVPDDLTSVFWRTEDKDQAHDYARNVEEYFQTVLPSTKVYLLTDLIASNDLQNFYSGIIDSVYSSFSPSNQSPLVDTEKYELEVALRIKYHGLAQTDMDLANELAKRSFALFAAESNTLWQLSSRKILPGLTLLAGARSTDTYKYEFLRIPADRPTLPKLFVI